MEEVSLENVIRRCGDFNRYQFLHYIFLSILNFSTSITGFYYVFGLAEPLFRCRLPSNVWPDDNQYQSYNTTHSLLLAQYQSFPSQCEINGTRCNSFVYDRSVFGRTFTEEADYICGGNLKKTWLSTAHQIGTFSILIAGPCADRIGRRKIIQIFTIALFIITIITQILLQFLHMSVNAKFILLFVNQVVSGLDYYSAGFLLLMELTSSSHTSFACGLTLIAYTIGEFLVAVFAYIARDWLLLKWITSIYFAISIPYLYFVPESPYWLLTRKKYKELEISLRQMAKLNGRSDDEWLPLYKQLVEDTNLIETTKKVEKKPVKRRICRHIPRLAISGFIEFVTMLLYTNISYGLGESNETLSPYWNFSIGVVVEIIGYLIAGVLITTPLGRKYSIISFATLTSICVLIIPFIMKPYPLPATIVSQFGKLFVSSTVSVSWIYVPELFPTHMRGLANAVFVFVGSFGSILAPIITEALGDKYVRISYYVYSGLIILLALIICTLPETRNRSFDDGEEEEEEEKHDDTNDNDEETSTKM